MNGTKKLSIRIFIILYGVSYFLQNSFFINRRKVYGAENPSTTNLVAIFVDKEIYPNIQANLERYTKAYLQGKIANSKAVVLPIDTTRMKANDIVQILENMYFEGIKDESSKLVGTILIGNVPLPVVENNGFIYPSIYPYVDFENQQFIYDTNKKFFVYNDNPNGQAELWHGIIKFDTATEYNKFFQKVKDYKTAPTTFIDKAIWYEDFIGLKKYFIPENTKYYINSMVFSQDIGYHRFNNLLLNILKGEHNDSILDIGNTLSNDLQNVEDPDLQAYASDIGSRNTEATTVAQDVSSSMPTLTLKKATQEMLKGYDGLMSSQFLAKIKDNIGGLARRYKTTAGETYTDYSSLTDKIVQKDNRLVGDADNNIQPLLIQMNDFLEKGLNDKIQEEKYYVNVPIPVSELDLEGDIKIPPTFRVTGVPPPKCIRTKYNYYENYLFGKNANQIIGAQQTNIFRGTFENLTSIAGQPIPQTGQGIGGSYDIFSTQVEANRGYDFSTTQEEITKYDTMKINKQEIWNKDCNLHLFGYCLRWKKTWKPDDSADEKKCYTGDTEKQGGCESMVEFSQRNRGGASPMNMDATTNQLKNYNYKDAKFPIYDIAGSRKISTAQSDANSYSGIKIYSALMQTRFAVKEKQENKSNNLYDFIGNPTANGVDLKFTNQIPTNTNLEHPIRAYNPPRTYAQTDFFNLFNGNGLTPTIYGGRAILYSRTPGTDILRCNMKGHIYMYKTIDSRVKNISPTRDQISDTEFYKFKDDSDLHVFYTNVLTDLAKIKADINNKNQEFSGADSLDITGVVSNLTQIKKIIASGNNGMAEIISFPAASLSSYSPTQVVALANDRSGKNLNLTKIKELTGRIEKVNQGLEGLHNYIDSLSTNNITLAFNDIIQSELFKNQKVEILTGWKTNINQNFDYIIGNVNALKLTFLNAKNIYDNIANLNNSIIGIVAKRTLIDALDISCLPNTCGCDANHYKPVCDVLDNLVVTLQGNIADLNDKVDEIALYQGDNGPVQPFMEINQLFSPAEVFNEITQQKTVMNTWDVSADPEKKEKNKGMNLTTQDRPIDNIRNITFQGIGGDTVRFNYPNLYEVKIYQQSGEKLILKDTGAIREAIKTYLKDKVTEYNTLLAQQKQKRDGGYFASKAAQFNFLGQLDPLANPNASVHTYTPIDQNFFINQLVTFLDILENAPEYGKKAIYGHSDANTIDEKIDMIAKLFYYQNITWQERLAQTTVVDDLAEIKGSFDINQKISRVNTTYLTEGSDEGKFITPMYNVTGYEVGYINSDGEDYISAKGAPTFIQQIQSAQEKAVNKLTISTESNSAEDLQADVDSCEGVDTQGTALLFDFKTFKSPWGAAMKCWMQKILKKPFDIKVGFKNAQGPVVLGIFKELINSFEKAGNERKEYGSQRSASSNEDTINSAPDDIKQTLEGYNNYAVVNIDKTIISVDTTGNSQIKIGMAQDMGNINVKISATGDNCVAISRNGTTYDGANICNKPAKEYYNPNKEEYIFDVVVKERKAGTTAIKIELCPPIGNICITKQQILNVIPGPISEIHFESPDIVMEGAEIPVIISAVDGYTNTIGQSIPAYTISVNSGDGKIYDGASVNASIKFDHFGKSSFIYQAPLINQNKKDVAITVGLAEGETGGIAPVIKTVTVVKGVVTVTQNNIVLFQTDVTQNIQPKIDFTLPRDESDIQYQDSGGMTQINPTNIPSLVVKIKTKGNNPKPLNNIVNIVSKQGLLMPGTIQEKSVVRNNVSKTQYVFNQGNDFVLTSGEYAITLYPTFKAGSDTITINIPGVDPIIIPVTVHPGAAKKVLMNLEKNRMDFTTTTSSKGIIHVVDSRNNKVTSGTIKLGVIGSATTNVSEFVYTGNEYTYTVTPKKPGGEGYVFAYIKDRTLNEQSPAYEKFIIQDSILPKEKLNVMYLNLFGTDRGNQRGYFSENEKVINTITSQSNKLLATTTEIVDPNKIKQIEYIINPHGQIQSINTKISTLESENKEFIVQMPEIAKIHLGLTSKYKILTLADSGAVSEFTKDSNTLLYIPESTDSVVTSNEATKTKITINGEDVLDLTQGIINPTLIITADNETLGDMSTYTMVLNSKTIGKLMIWSNDSITSTKANVNIQDPITYGTTNIFSEGSTNTEGIGIYVNSSTFTKQGYLSIEDSTDALLGIGFTSKFKNVANFANGKTVGEATLPYGSHFLINFGDPLLERRENNPIIPDTDFDASIGQTIYADPNKTIFKVLPIDFDNNGTKDLIVVYTDGVVKLLKNYGGTDPYKNMQELMIIAEPIKEINIGDVDGNNYPDIFIITNNSKGIVYLNDKGVFSVDGKNICLNVNVEPDMINPKPDDFSNIKQMFVEDMDQDGKLDIVTKDILDDVKIFYGGNTNNGANYISSINGACDAGWYTRQKNTYTIIKRFGTKINSNRHIQDGSLIHRKGVEAPKEGDIEEVEAPDTSAPLPSNLSKAEQKAIKNQALNDVKKMVANTNEYIAAGASQLAFVDNPLSTAPVYETLPKDQITYLPINETNDAVSVYKEWQDMNAGILRDGDEVVVKTTIVSKKNNNKVTYIDQLLGPWTIVKDDTNKINSLVFTQGNTGGLIMDWNTPEGYQFVVDNIQLGSGAAISFSYKVKYKADKSTINIDVGDQDLFKENKYKDKYADITINSTDACQKNRWILFNEKTGNKRSYKQVYDDIQKEMNDFSSGAQADQQAAIGAVVDQLASVETLDNVSSIPGMNNLEARSAQNLLSTLTSQGGGLSLNIGGSFIDNATANVSKKIDSALQGLCQGFKLGKDGKSCQGVPLPFNQAFLAPGDYHIFGCVPKLPNPLYPIFKTLNTTLGKGMPLLNIPAGLTTPAGQTPFFGIFGFPQKSSIPGAEDGFSLGGPGGLYPSQFRLYIAPTLTLGLGIAMCFGLYSVGKVLPKPFRDMGGNCIVFAVPPITTCPSTPSTPNQPTKESLGSSMVAAAGQGTCNNPPRIGNTIVMAGDNTIFESTTASSPLQMVAAGSSENDPPYSAAIPQGNFGGLMVMDQEPTKLTAQEDYENANEQYNGYDLQKGPSVKNKIVGAKNKGIVECVVQKWMTSQITYIQNNLTKMTIQIDLPDVSTVFQGFDKIGNLAETYKAINKADQEAGYIKSTEGQGVDLTPGTKGGTIKWTDKLSKQQISNLSKQIGSNPFEAIQEIFREVPLIKIDTKDLNIKVPALTSDDINKYVSYLTIRKEKNEQILKDWTMVFNEVLAVCGTTDKATARDMIKKLEAEKAADTYSSLDNGEKNRIEGQINDMNNILALTGDTTRKEMAADINNILINAKNTTTKIVTLPYWKVIQGKLAGQKVLQDNLKKRFPVDKQARLDAINGIVHNLEKCSGIVGSLDGFLSFRENTAGIIRSVKQNIKVLQKYKEFPNQLYDRTHLTDRYLTEISSLLSNFVGGINNFLSVNANRFSQYVDAIILMIGSIKTWQAIIDFSVNRSQKCSKCSNDNYGSFSCSLSFLCPKLPIFPIPAFKIPNIYMDLSHMELGMNIILPKINFVPIKIPLPQIPNLPEPPTMEIDLNADLNLNLDFIKGLSLPTIPVIPEPPTLPEPPSFIPSIKMDLPVLPPAPKISKILPEINAVLKIADFIGKIFCIVKGGIGLVGEKGVKGKIEQLTERTWNVPVFDFFDFTTKFKDPPLQGFDYQLDAYTTLKFNFDGVYDVFNNITSIANGFVSKNIEGPIQRTMDDVNKTLNNNGVTSGFNGVDSLNQNVNFNGYNTETEDITGMIDYRVVHNELEQGLIAFKNKTLTDKKMNDRVKTILATVENKSTILPATSQIEQAEKGAKNMINEKIQENETLQKEIKNYNTFIKKIQNDNVVLVSDATASASFNTPLLTIDSPTKQILQSQEDPTKTYLTLNQKMVQGYLDAVNNDGAEKLKMSATTYKKSKAYLETTKEKIDTALLAYTDKPLLAQTPPCTNCSNNAAETNYSTDISAYVQGVFIESYSGDQNSSGTTKSMVNTVTSSEQVLNVQQTYTTDIDLNNDKFSDILMYDANTIYVKYAKQDSEHFSKGNNSMATYYTNKFYSYASEHPGNIFNQSSRYIKSLDQLRNNSDEYGYTTINGMTIKVVDKNLEPKNFKTDGQTFDNLQLSRENSQMLGERVDGYIMKVSQKVDNKDNPGNSRFENLLGIGDSSKYILVLPKDTDYTGTMLTIDTNFIKKRVTSQLGNSILAVEYYDPEMKKINVTLKNLPRKRLYTSLATLTITQEDLNLSQQKTLTLYKKTSPRSNQTVAGMQNLGDTTAPVGDIVLWRNTTSEAVSTGVTHEGYINTLYTLKSFRTDNVIVAKMIVQKDGVTILEKDNQAATGTIDIEGLFFTGTTQQSYDFIAIDQNNNITKETVTLDIKIPDIEVIDMRKSGEETADVIAKISNDLDEGTVIFQRLRNGIRKDIEGSNQNAYGGFDLTPRQTVITGGIFTIGNDIGLYDTLGNEIATIDPKTGEIKINAGFENKVKLHLSFNTHIPVIELRDTTQNITLFQMVLPIAAISNIEMNEGKPNYEQIVLSDGQFGDFNGGYCIKNNKNDCVVYTNQAGAIYIPGIYASSLMGEYVFDTVNKVSKFIIKDQSNKAISTLTLQIKSNQ